MFQAIKISHKPERIKYNIIFIKNSIFKKMNMYT